jgi:hypothetical protein
VHVDLASQRSGIFPATVDVTVTDFVVTVTIGFAAPSATTGARVQTTNAAANARAAAT